MAPSQTSPGPHAIRINVVNGRVQVTPNSQHSKRSEALKWTCDDGNYAILFSGDSPSDRPGGGNRSGQPVDMSVRANANAGSYKYIVAVASGNDVLIVDPEIIIDVP